MKVYVRNRSVHYGDQSMMFPYQAILWFRREGSEPDRMARLAATRFQVYLTRDLQMSFGALGMIQSVQGLEHARSGARGILFSNRKYANEARSAVDDWLYDQGEYTRLLEALRRAR